MQTPQRKVCFVTAAHTQDICEAFMSSSNWSNLSPMWSLSNRTHYVCPLAGQDAWLGREGLGVMVYTCNPSMQGPAAGS
jgi:hypothetical protein